MLGNPLLKNKKVSWFLASRLLVSWFLGCWFLVSWFLGSLISWFLVVSWFLDIVVSWFLGSKNSLTFKKNVHKNTFHVFG